MFDDGIVPVPADPTGVGSSLLRKRFLVVGGKGGVGRTVVSVALARLLARSGRRVLLAHVRTRQRVGQMLGFEPIDDQIRQADDGLWVVNMNPQSALRERGMMTLRFKVVYRAVMENRLVKHFLRAIPSLDEYSMLGKAWYHTIEEVDGRPRFDTVIFDGPATGHLITMLRIPQVITEIVPEGPLTRDAVQVRDLLADPRRTGLFIVTLAEEMPVSESIDLHQAARDELGIAAELLVVNGLYPEDLDQHEPWVSESLQRLRGVGPDALRPLAREARVLLQRRAINRRYLERLGQKLPLPQVRLPLLFTPELGPESIAELVRHLEAQLFSP